MDRKMEGPQLTIAHSGPFSDPSSYCARKPPLAGMQSLAVGQGFSGRLILARETQWC